MIAFSLGIDNVKQSFALVPVYTATTLLLGSVSLYGMAQGVMLTAAAASTATSVICIAPGVFLTLASLYCAFNASRNLPLFNQESYVKVCLEIYAYKRIDTCPAPVQVLNALFNILTVQRMTFELFAYQFNRCIGLTRL